MPQSHFSASKANRRREEGQTIVIIAAAMVILLVFGAFAVDLSFAYFQRRSMQNAADAAALAGSRSLGAYQSDPTSATLTTGDLYQIIHEYALRNKAQSVQAFYTSPGGTRVSEIVSGSSDTVPTSGVTGVEVIAGTDFSTFFAKVLGYTILPAQARASASYGAASSARHVSPIAVKEENVQLGESGTLWNRNEHTESVDTGWLALNCQYPSYGAQCTPSSGQVSNWLDEGYAGFVRTQTQVSGVSGDEFWSGVSSVSPGDVLIVPVFDQVFHYTTNEVCEPGYIAINGDEECLEAEPLAGVTPVYTTNAALETTYYYNILSFAAFEVHTVGGDSLDGKWVSYSVEGDWVNPHNKGVYVAKLTDVPVAELPVTGTPTTEPGGFCDASLAISFTPEEVEGCGPYVFTLMVENTGEQGSARDVVVQISAITGLEWVDSISPSVWNVGDMPAGQIRTTQVVITPKDSWYSAHGPEIGAEIKLRASVVNEGCRPDHNIGRSDTATGIKASGCEPATPTPQYTATPMPTPIPLYTPGSGEPTETPTPTVTPAWMTTWDGSLGPDYAICQYEPGWITITGTVSTIPTGSYAFLQTAWRVVYPTDEANICPPAVPNCRQEQYSSRLIIGDTEFSIQAWWPGIRPTDGIVEIHYGANLLDRNRNPVRWGIGKDIYWYPWFCPAPTPAPSATPTPTATPNWVGHHKIDFLSSSFDGTNTTFTYRVTSGRRPAISHWVLTGCFEHGDVVWASEMWEYVTSDPNLQLQGVKFDRGYNDNESRVVSFKLRGRYNTDNQLFEVGVKSGPQSHFGSVVGPGCWVEPQATVTWTPTATATETTTPSPTPTPTPFSIRVNAGGGSWNDPRGNAWSGDMGYSGGQKSSGNHNIAGTDLVTIMQSHRYGSTFNYGFINIPNGLYRVNLWFAETHFTYDGRRIFDVSINHIPAISGLDVHAVAGHDGALLRAFIVQVSDNTLRLDFSASVNNAMISGIEILEVQEE